jgi:hypothetical protein
MPGKREVIQPKSGDRRYVRRDADGRFTEDQTSTGRSLSADQRKKAKTVVSKGQGDRGDRAARSR